MMITKVHGRFTRWDGILELDEAHLADSSVRVEIEVASIDTAEAKRDGHLRSPEFLDAEHHPVLRFESTRIEPTGKSAFDVQGELTIRDTTRLATLSVEYLGRREDRGGKEHVRFSARTTLRRADFGLRWSQALEAGGWLVGDKVEVKIDAEATRAERVHAGVDAPAPDRAR